jgi:hypothetical protein
VIRICRELAPLAASESSSRGSKETNKGYVSERNPFRDYALFWLPDFGSNQGPAEHRTVAEYWVSKCLRAIPLRNCREFAIRKVLITLVSLGIADRKPVAFGTSA